MNKLIMVALLLGTTMIMANGIDHRKSIKDADSLQCTIKYIGTKTKDQDRYKMEELTDLDQYKINLDLSNHGRIIMVLGKEFIYMREISQGYMNFVSSDRKSIEIKRIRSKDDSVKYASHIFYEENNNSVKAYAECLSVTIE